MAKRQFVAVDRDYVREREASQSKLRERFLADSTLRVVIYQNFSDGYESSLSLAVTEAGEVLRERNGYVYQTSPSPGIWDLLEKALKRARNDLKVCLRIQKALKETREFGSGSLNSTFSGLLKHPDG